MLIQPTQKAARLISADRMDRKRSVLSAPDASPLALKGSACAPPIKANGADCDSQFWREQAPAKTCESRGSSGAFARGEMKTRPIIASFEEYHSYVTSCEGQSTVFRGVRKVSYDLKPSIGRRTPMPPATPVRMERRMFRLFCESALPHLPFMPRSPWEWLAVAQHHGMPTRLLDWSTTPPLVGLYFAVEKEFDGDSAVYVFRGQEVVDTKEIQSPFDVTEVSKYRPSHVTERIIAQGGMFTVHPDPQVPFHSPEVEKIIVAKDCKRDLKKLLYKYGVSRKALFPGVDGVAADLDWLLTTKY